MFLISLAVSYDRAKMLDDIKKRLEFPNAVIQSQVTFLKALNKLNCLWKPLFQGLLPDSKKDYLSLF